MRCRIGSALTSLGFLLMVGLVPLTSNAVGPVDASVTSREEMDWPSYNGSLEGERFSQLTEINSANAASLTEVCRVKISDLGAFHMGPVVVKDTMFVTTVRDTVALDARTCAVRWRSSYQPVQTEPWGVNRGVAYLNGRLFRGTGDDRLLAMDAKTGEMSWTDVIGDPKRGEFISAAPIAWNGVVYLGVAGGDFGIKGRMMAFDAMTGREIWRFNLIPTGSEVGAATWKAGASTGGGGTWSSYAIDPVANELFVPVGNPSPDFAPDSRPGANLFTDSLVVLDAGTGALKWWYQISPHDSHDLDLAAPPMLYRDDTQREVVALAGKDGFLRVIDRGTHKLLFKSALTTVDAATARLDPFPQGLRICPGSFGGTEWNGPAFDPVRKLVFSGAVDWCTIVSSAPPHYVAGQLYFGGMPTPDGPASGWITAVDSNSGVKRWQFHAPGMVVSGITATAGGVLFAGDLLGNFFVFDSATGALLKQQSTGGAVAGGIVTYSIAGRQYVATTSGNVSRLTFGAAGHPSIIVYGLPLTASDSAPRTVDSRGQQVFNEVCAACHTLDGTVRTGPSLRHLRDHLSTEQILDRIRNPLRAMPRLVPGTISDEDAVAVAEYLQSQ